jgi:hypothetical protein
VFAPLAELNQNNQDLGPNLTNNANDGTDLKSSTIDIIQNSDIDHNVAYGDHHVSSEEEFIPFLQHPILASMPSWTVSDAVGVNSLVADDVFLSYYTSASSKPLGYKLRNFAYFRGKLRVTVVVQGCPFAAGKLVVSFDPKVTFPSGAPSVAGSIVPYPRIVRALQLPNMIIDPSKTTSYTIDLPAPTPNGYWSTHYNSTTNSFGSYSMRMVVMNPLTTGTTTVPVVSMFVYISMVEPHCEALTYEFTSGVLMKEKKPGNISSAFEKLSDISKVMANYMPPNISPGVTLFSKVAGATGDFLRFFGFSKGQIHEMDKSRITSHNNYSHIDEKIHADILALRGNNSVGFDDQSIPLLSKEDQMISHLCQKVGLVDICVIASDDASGTLFRVHGISPMLNLVVNVDNEYELTPLSYVGLPYWYWRGELTVDIEFICSVFHRCSVIICYDPFGDAASPPIMSDAVQVLKHWTVTVSGNTTTTLTLPWRQVQPWKYVSYPHTSGGIVTTGADYLNGHLFFYVLNPVVSNGSTDGIYVNTYLSSKNIQFAQVSEIDWQIEYTSNEYVKTFGEEMAHSVKELANRSCKYLTFTPVGDHLFAPFFSTSQASCVASTPLLLPNPTCTITKHNDLLQYLSRAYVGVRGSITYTIIPSYARDAKNVVVVEDADESFQTAFTKVDTEMPDMPSFGPSFYANGSIEGNYSFTIPMYTPAYFIPTTGEPDHTTDLHEGSVNVFRMGLTAGVVNADIAGSSIPIQMMRQGGDDFEFVGYRGFPLAHFG